MEPGTTGKPSEMTDEDDGLRLAVAFVDGQAGEFLPGLENARVERSPAVTQWRRSSHRRPVTSWPRPQLAWVGSTIFGPPVVALVK